MSTTSAPIRNEVVVVLGGALYTTREIRKSVQSSGKLHSQKGVSCSKSAACLLPCSHQADIKMRLHECWTRLSMHNGNNCLH